MILLDITTWWSEKVLLEQIFWGLAVPASAVLTILLITTFLGFDSDIDIGVDDGVEMDSGAGFQFFTFKNLVGFFTIFGWVGLGCVASGYTEFTSVAIAFVAGILMMASMAWVFYFMSKMTEDGTMIITNAIGRLAEAYMPIPGDGSGIGRVQINMQGGIREMEAMTHDIATLPTGTIVKVLEIIDGHILLVTKHNPNN